MAINPESQYPGKVTPSSASYPYGKARNITSPGDGTGTPLEAAWVNDVFGLMQAILSGAGLVPSGTPDTALASQYLNGILGLAGKQTSTTTTMKALASADLIDGQRILVTSGSDSGHFVVKSGANTPDNEIIYQFTDDANRYAQRVYNFPLRDYEAGDFAPRFNAIFDAEAIRLGAGIPLGIEVGVRAGKTAGLSAPGSLVDDTRINLTSDAAVAAKATSGTGTEADPYIIENLRLDNSEATGSLNGLNWDDASATVYLKLRNCQIYGYSGTQVTAYVPTKLTLENCQIYSGGGTGRLIRVGRGGTVVVDQCDIAGGSHGVYTDTTSRGNIYMTDTQFSSNGNVWSGGLGGTNPVGVYGEDGAGIIDVRYCDFIAVTVAIVTFGNVDEWIFYNNDLSSGVSLSLNFYGAGASSKNGKVRYCKVASAGTQFTWQEDLDIGYCEFNDSPNGARVLWFLSDGGASKRVKVHHCKFTKTTGTYVASNEVCESLPNNGQPLNEDITFEYNWSTACVEDAFEMVGTINGVVHHCVADNCAGQAVDFFTDIGNSLPCLGGEIHHIYGDCGDVGVIITDVDGVRVSGHIFIDNTASSFGGVRLQAIGDPGNFPRNCTIVGPLSLPASTGNGNPFETQGTLGPGNTAVWQEGNAVQTYGSVTASRLVVR